MLFDGGIVELLLVTSAVALIGSLVLLLWGIDLDQPAPGSGPPDPLTPSTLRQLGLTRLVLPPAAIRRGSPERASPIAARISAAIPLRRSPQRYQIGAASCRTRLQRLGRMARRHLQASAGLHASAGVHQPTEWRPAGAAGLAGWSSGGAGPAAAAAVPAAALSGTSVRPVRRRAGAAPHAPGVPGCPRSAHAGGWRGRHCRVRPARAQADWRQLGDGCHRRGVWPALGRVGAAGGGAAARDGQRSCSGARVGRWIHWRKPSRDPGEGSQPARPARASGQVGGAKPVALDRWRVELLGEKQVEPELVIANNYLGVGVDAQISLDFHTNRERRSHLFLSRFINKIWYAVFGGKSIFFPTCHDFEQRVTLEADGVAVPLPPGVQGVVMLNIMSYGGGCNLWGRPEAAEAAQAEEGVGPEGVKPRSGSFCELRPPSMQDKLLEVRLGPGAGSGVCQVVGVGSSFELALGQVGIDAPLRICQARSIRISITHPMPIQIDGEPRVFHGAISVSHLGQRTMLAAPIEREAPPSRVQNAVIESLEWACGSGVIDAETRDTLRQEISRRIQMVEEGDSGEDELPVIFS